MITLFKKVKTIVSKQGVVHFERWAIIEIRNCFALYVHKISKADEDQYLHSHPWNFIGVILSGAYREKTNEGINLRRAGSILAGTRNYFHKIAEIVDGPVFTLFFVFGKHKPWYYSLGVIPSEQYRELKQVGLFPLHPPK